MPELPEVETMRLQLSKFLVGHKILSVDVTGRKTFQGDETKLIGGKIASVRRFGKVSVIDLSNNYSILTHVKLTGQYIYRGPNLKNSKKMSGKVIGGVPGPHTLVTFSLDSGGKLYYNDVRRFGWLKVVKTPDVENEPFVKKLGPEPFKDLTEPVLGKILSTTKRPIKVILMDQEKIGGVGNIYANDALWLAGIDPRRKSNSLEKKEVVKLFKSIISVLKAGLKYGGASELSFVTPDGEEGEYQKHTLVYGLVGEPCEKCHKSLIKKIFLGGRGTYYCPICQK